MTNNSDVSKEDNSSIRELLNTFKLCDHCIGRLCTHRISDDETFEQAGKRYRKKETQLSEIETNHCYLCEGLFEELPDFYQIAKNAVSSHEFSSFLMGCTIDEDILFREKQLIERFQLSNTASVKQEINEYIGIKLEEELGKTVEFKHPDIMIILNTQFNLVRLQIKSLYVYGRYTKHERGIPQTKWFCRRCHGKGCRYCKYTGKLYEHSVEEYVGAPFVAAANAIDESFHGAGREDIDVRMLGTGRPFVLELKNPKIRTLDLENLSKRINNKSHDAIRVNSLKYTTIKDIARIKNGSFQKVYVVKIHAQSLIQKEKLKKVALSLQGTTINQQTPTRVAKRRANKVRQRKIYRCNILEVDAAMASLEIETESGTYIKELVTGDEGRTQPNISDLLDDTCVVETLDVIEVKGE